MRAGFSEFSFAYALTEGLVTYQRPPYPIVPPYFPTLYEENRVGYDVVLSQPCCLLFLQFKLCEGMVRETAKEIAVDSLPLATPFLRMKLMPSKRSPQHRLLLELERKDERVFYAAPRLYKYSDFSRCYRDRRIVQNSAFIMPSDIGYLPDDNEHHVSFEKSADIGWLLSEPVEVDRILAGDGLIERIMEDLKDERSARERGHIAVERMLTVLAEHEIREDGTTDEDDDMPFRRLAFLARQHFDASLVPIYRHSGEG